VNPQALEPTPMMFPVTTAFWAAILALMLVGLSAWVVAGRVGSDVLVGDGDDRLARRIRAQGNFTEYVPLALLVIALYEASGGSHALVVALCIVLVVARVLHPFGMFAGKNTPRQFACRGGGILATLLVIVVAAVALLARVA
jgi:uncharacterized protein